MSFIDQLRRLWFYTHLSTAELQQGQALAAADSHPNWRSWALTEVVYRDHDVLSKAFAIASFLPLVIVMFLSGLASAPCRERRLPALNLLLYLILSVVLNVVCKSCIRSERPAHPAAGMNYTTIHGMPSDHSQFMAGVAVYLARRWNAGATLSAPASHPTPSLQRKNSSPTNMVARQPSTPSPHRRECMPRLLSAFLFFAALFVGAGRVYNGYHTVGQVLVGWAVGVVFALACTTATAQRVLSQTSETVMLPVMLVCTYWTNAVC